MGNDDINKALDEILAKVDKELSDHVGAHKGEEEPKTSKPIVDIPVIKESKIPQQDEKFSGGHPTTEDSSEPELPKAEEKKVEYGMITDFDLAKTEREKRQYMKEGLRESTDRKPLLEEIAEDPLQVTRKELSDEEALSIPNLKRGETVLEQESPVAPQIPNIDSVKEKSRGEVVIPKKSQTKSISSSLRQKKQAVINKIIKLLVASLAAVVVAVAVPNIDHNIAVNSYKDNSSQLNGFIANDIDGKLYETNLEHLGRDLGFVIGSELAVNNLVSVKKDYDVNRALIKYLAISYDTIVKAIPYTEKGAMGEGNALIRFLDSSDRGDYWMDTIYNSAATRLREDQVIELPNTLEEYLRANGFYDCDLSYNVYRNTLHKEGKTNVDNRGALKNLSAYGNYLIGKDKNPEDALSEKFYETIGKMKNVLGDFTLGYHDGKYHITSKEDGESYSLKGSEGDINFITVEPENSDSPQTR